MRVSLLDRSRTRVGESDAAAIASTVDRAVRAEALGFRRFWTAEHHAVPGIASAAPTVLLAAIGAQTRSIRCARANRCPRDPRERQHLRPDEVANTDEFLASLQAA